MAPGICYLPPALPDEVLYSYIARVAACNALGTPKACLETLFGTQDIIPCTDLPTRLAALYHRLDGEALFSSIENLIETHTLYPYHRPFLTPERHAQGRHALLQGHGKGLKTALGRVANRFGANPPLRYCHACNQDDIKRHGTPYWHRSHQLPGVTCCTIHHSDLIALASVSTRSDRQLLLLPPGVPAPHTQSTSATEQWQFSVLSKDLLETGLPPMDPLLRKAIYTEAATRLGFGIGRQRVDHYALAGAVRKHYRDFEGFQHKERLLSTAAHPLRWIDDLFVRPSRSSHPICHLLLIGFLYPSIEIFKQAVLDSDLQNAPDVPPACTGATPATTMLACYNQETILRDTSLSCRAAATILGLSVTTVVTRRRVQGIPIAERRKYLHANVLTLASAAIASGQAPTTIAQQHGLSLSTVYRLRQQTVTPSVPINRPVDLQKRGLQRSRWQLAIAQHGRTGFQAVRAHAAATYMWLYRHDRDWLVQSGKPPPKPKKPSPRVDWQARDQAMCDRLQRHVTALHVDPHRPRLSRSYLYRYIGETMVRQHQHSLPRFVQLVANITESPQAFRCFRIARAVEQLNREGTAPTLWRIQRLAGIKNFTDTLQTHAIREIQKVNRPPFGP